MLDKIVDNFSGWLRRWSDVALAPRQHFLKPRPQPISAAWFFVGNHLVGYVSVVIVSLLYFFAFHRAAMFDHVADDLKEKLEALVLLFPGYTLANFVLLFAAALLSFFGAKISGSRATFPSHLRAHLDLSAWEPLAVAGTTLAILLGTSHSVREIVILWIALFFAIGTRIWILIAGYFAIEGLHPLTPVKRIGAYVLFLIPAVLGTLATLAILWMMLGLIVLEWD